MQDVYIYKLIDPETNKVRYVGKTIDPVGRFRTHRKTKTKTHCSCWIRSLKNKGLLPLFQIIEVCDSNSWKERERYWISFYGSDLVNHSPGGDGEGRKHTDETRKKMSETRKGRPGYNKGVPLCDEVKKILSQRMKEYGKFNFHEGYTHSEETRKKMSASRKGVKRGPYKKRNEHGKDSV